MFNTNYEVTSKRWDQKGGTGRKLGYDGGGTVFSWGRYTRASSSDTIIIYTTCQRFHWYLAISSTFTHARRLCPQRERLICINKQVSPTDVVGSACCCCFGRPSTTLFISVHWCGRVSRGYAEGLHGVLKFSSIPVCGTRLNLF